MKKNERARRSSFSQFCRRGGGRGGMHAMDDFGTNIQVTLSVSLCLSFFPSFLFFSFCYISVSLSAVLFSSLRCGKRRVCGYSLSLFRSTRDGPTPARGCPVSCRARSERRLAHLVIWLIAGRYFFLLSWFPLSCFFGRSLHRPSPGGVLLRRFAWAVCLVFPAFLPFSARRMLLSHPGDHGTGGRKQRRRKEENADMRGSPA